MRPFEKKTRNAGLMGARYANLAGLTSRQIGLNLAFIFF